MNERPMNSRQCCVVLAFGAALLGASPPACAGDLTPPAGAVEPTMKPLLALRPGETVSAEAFPGDADSLIRITEPGVYVLTGDLFGVAGKHGIEIDADNVTIIGNGFELTGTGGSLSGINVDGAHSNIRVVGLSVSLWGAAGVNMSTADASRLDRVFAFLNGGSGIVLGDDGRMSGCIGNSNAGSGIVAGSYVHLENCTASGNGENGSLSFTSTVWRSRSRRQASCSCGAARLGSLS